MVIVENKVEHFHSLCCNEIKLVNFHAVRCLTSSSIYVSKLHLIVEYSLLFLLVKEL